MIILTRVRSSSKMGIVAPVVLEIIEKTIAYVITMFWKKIFFFSKFVKILNRNNKQTFRCYGNTESGPLFCTDKFLKFSSIFGISLLQYNFLKFSSIFDINFFLYMYSKIIHCINLIYWK